MNTIITKQNEPQHLLKMKAQRQLYTEAKKILLWQIILVAPITIALSLLKTFFPVIGGINVIAIVALYGGLLTIFDLVLIMPVISNYKKDAANIQEQFDTEVYGMEWNTINAGKKVPAEKINKYGYLYQPDPQQPVEDWYPATVATMPLNNAILVCQKSNLHYDRSLRQKYKQASIVSAVLLFLFLVALSLVRVISFPNFLTQVFLPFLPALVLVLKIVNEHNKSITTANDLHQSAMALGEQLGTPSMDGLRKIQDKIYCSRKDSPLVPDLFYKKKRGQLEVDMHVNAAARL